MTYDTECTGDISEDIIRPKSQNNGGSKIYKGSAAAVKIVPKSRCLDAITFLGIKRYTTESMKIEIRENNASTNLPKGAPGTSDGLIGNVVVPYNHIPPDFGNPSVTLGLLLPIANTQYWLVIYSSDFNCKDGNIGAGFERFELSYDTSSDDALAHYLLSVPPYCLWSSTVVGAWALTTYKKTYVPPPPTGTLHFVVTSSGTPLEGVSISVDGTNKGTTNASGILDVPNLTYGATHSVTASKSGYDSVSSSVLLDSTTKTVNVLMTKTTGGGGISGGAVVGLIVAAGVAAAILYFATRRQE